MLKTSATRPLAAGTPRMKAMDARRTIRDVSIALASFAALAGAIGWNSAPPKPAIATDLVSISSPAGVAAGQPTTGWTQRGGLEAALSLPQVDTGHILQHTDHGAAVALLAAAFTAIVAFNLAFLRHLGRVYASSRPGGRRRG